MGHTKNVAHRLMEELRAQFTESDTDERRVLAWSAELKGLLVDAYRWSADQADDEDIRRLYLRLANEEGQRIEQLRAEEQAMALALTDSLTGLENRRSFDRRLRTELARVRRYGQSLSCVLVDVDNFKTINDQWGHTAGDEVLRQLAQVITATVRGGDVAARYGGDEFAVLLPHTTPETAHRAAERLRNAIHTSTFTWTRKTLPLRVSVGIASASPEQPGDDLVRRADEDLVRSKRSTAK